MEVNRPTCVTVIGWAWIVLGGLMALSAVMGLVAYSMVAKNLGDEGEPPLLLRVFPLASSIQVCVAAAGMASGIGFLKLKTWSRLALELLTWPLLLFVLGFVGYWISEWIGLAGEHASGGVALMGLVMGTIIGAVYAVPLGIMLKFLRGGTVRNAFEMPA